MSEEDYPDDEEYLRRLNEQKKQELHDEFGMNLDFYHSDLPPEAEADFLDYIQEFERQFEHAERISVRAFMGNPIFRPLEEIPPGKLEEALEQALEVLAAHNIAIDFIFEVPLEEQYRFITEELLDEETDDIHIPDMVSHFIYEEFHPNDQEDAKQFAGEFFEAVVENNEELLKYSTGDEGHFDSEGNPVMKDEFLKAIKNFQQMHPVISSYSLESTHVAVDGDFAWVEANVFWEGLSKSANNFITTTGIAKFRLIRSIYGGWDVVQFQFPNSKITS